MLVSGYFDWGVSDYFYCYFNNVVNVVFLVGLFWVGCLVGFNDVIMFGVLGFVMINVLIFVCVYLVS